MLRAPQVGIILRRVGPQPEESVVLEERVYAAEAEAEKNARGKAAATFAGHQYIGAGGALGIDQRPVLLHDELPAQRNHKQNTQPSAEQRQRKDPARLQIESKKDQRGQGKNNARRNRLACVSRGLHNVVFQNAGPAKRPQDRDRQHGDRDARGHRQPGAKSYINSYRAEEHAEERAQYECSRRQLRPRLARGNKGLEGRLARYRCGHVDAISRVKNRATGLCGSVSAAAAFE
jgi:hypothetical protein